ncbi:hypothetical protein HanRHA438_Chr14g0639301 [Helianthus annuus]|nr:hypothetical protein HanRHA438_Chr14g0639301 [Helianthus annuus]
MSPSCIASSPSVSHMMSKVMEGIISRTVSTSWDWAGENPATFVSNSARSCWFNSRKSSKVRTFCNQPPQIDMNYLVFSLIAPNKKKKS